MKSTDDSATHPKHFVLIKQACLDAQGRRVSAEAAAKRLLDFGRWPLWQGTRNRRAITAGARLAIYLAGSCEVIAMGAVARVDLWNAEHRRTYPLLLDGAPAAVLVMEDLHLFSTPVPVKERLQRLSFISAGSKKWGVAFMGGTRAVNAEDFAVLTGSPPADGLAA